MDHLTRRDLNTDPFRQFELWFQAAEAAGINYPNAMALATATRDGCPSVRMILLKTFDTTGFVFYSNYESQKGQELAENPRAELLLYWDELRRQVRIGGHVGRIAAGESDRYFRSRPRRSQLGSLASPQSQVIPGRELLNRRFVQLERQFEGREVPRPDHWGGYRLVPEMFEFWQNRPDRLHDRFRYTRGPDNRWRIERLAP